MSPADNVPTDGLAGSGLMVSRGQDPHAVMAEGLGWGLLLAKIHTTPLPTFQFCERNVYSHLVNAQSHDLSSLL